MSCFIVERKSIIKICDGLTQLKRIESLKDSVEEIFQEINNLFDFNIDNVPFSKWYNILANELYKLNYKAYSSRYREHENYITVDFYRLRENNDLKLDFGIYYNVFYHFNDNIYNLCKTIDCFLYQCGEGEVKENPIYLKLKELNKKIKIWVFEQSTASQNADWE